MKSHNTSSKSGLYFQGYVQMYPYSAVLAANSQGIKQQRSWQVPETTRALSWGLVLLFFFPRSLWHFSLYRKLPPPPTSPTTTYGISYYFSPHLPYAACFPFSKAAPSHPLWFHIRSLSHHHLRTHTCHPW